MSAYVGKFFTAVSAALEFNTATLSGAMDIVVIEDADGSRKSTPFHVRFGKLQLLKSRGIPIDIDLNGHGTRMRMLLGAAGEAYFYNPPVHVAGPGTNPATTLVVASSSPTSPLRSDVAVHPKSLSPCINNELAVDMHTPVLALPVQSSLDSQRIGSDGSASRLVSSSYSPLSSASLPRSGPHSLSRAVRSPPRLSASANASQLSPSRSASSPPSDASPTPPTPPTPSSHSLRAEEIQQLDEDYHFAHGSDSEAEISHALRVRRSEVVDEPRSPPIAPSTALRNWSSSTPTVRLPAPSASVSSAASSVLRSTHHVAFALRATRDELRAGANVDAGEADGDNSALLDLSGLPDDEASVATLTSHELLRVDVGVGEQVDDRGHPANVTLCASMHDVDVAGEEERKLDFRSVDGYDADEDDVDVIDGMQRHVTRVLSASQQPTLQTTYSILQSHETAEATADDDGSENAAATTAAAAIAMTAVTATAAADDDASAPPSDTDPPSERDDVVAMSLCGSLLSPHMQEFQVMELFERHRVSFPDFAVRPNLLFHPSMLFRIENRIVELRVAAPLLFAALAFNQRMDVDHLARVTAALMRERGDMADGQRVEGGGGGGGGGDAESDGVMPVADQGEGEAAKSPPTPRRFRWFGWSSSSVVGKPLLEEDDIHALEVRGSDDNLRKAGIDVAVQQDDCVQDVGNNIAAGDGSDKRPWIEGDNRNIRALPQDMGNEDGNAEVKSEEESKSIGEAVADIQNGNVCVNHDEFSDVNEEYLSLTPTGEQLKTLALKPGANTLRFYVSASSVELNCRIFLWSCHSKIVISDVDGTITRSDVLGQFLPAVGRDWSQVGVAGLYTQIEKNGYKLLYLTARPIGQASQTRTFLHSVTQGSAKLPNGPVLMSPNRLVESFTREVIRRKPHEFKIAALREVRCLFSPDFNPFHAGFGNRDTDVISYRAVGLIPQRIFVVNHRGELVVMKARLESAASYSTLQDLVESVFPDISGDEGREKIKTLTENATYNDWNYWRGNLPTIDFNQLLLCSLEGACSMER